MNLGQGLNLQFIRLGHLQPASPAYGQFSKVQSGEMGPAPGRSEPSKGIFRSRRATPLGFESLSNFWILLLSLLLLLLVVVAARIEVMRTDRAGLDEADFAREAALGAVLDAPVPEYGLD